MSDIYEDILTLLEQEDFNSATALITTLSPDQKKECVQYIETCIVYDREEGDEQELTETLTKVGLLP